MCTLFQTNWSVNTTFLCGEMNKVIHNEINVDHICQRFNLSEGTIRNFRSDGQNVVWDVLYYHMQAAK